MKKWQLQRSFLILPKFLRKIQYSYNRFVLILFLNAKTATAATTMTATNTMITMSRTLEAVRKGEGVGDDDDGGWVEVEDGGGSAASVLTT